MDSSGRQSMATFERGTGDAIVTYENELLLQRKMTGKAAPYVDPSRHALDRRAGGRCGRLRRLATATARSPRRFSRSSARTRRQRILAEYGFRPLDSASSPPVASRFRRDCSPWPTSAAGPRSTSRSTTQAASGTPSSPAGHGEGGDECVATTALARKRRRSPASGLGADASRDHTGLSRPDGASAAGGAGVRVGTAWASRHSGRHSPTRSPFTRSGSRSRRPA